MISPQYLDRLYEIPPSAYPIEPIWRDLIGAHRIGERPNMILLLLARSAFTIVAKSRGIQFRDQLMLLRDLHRDKNAGYAGDNPDPWANFRECNAFGITTVDGVLARMCDKMARYRVISANVEHERVGESGMDTLLDLGSYAIILTCIVDEQGGMDEWMQGSSRTTLGLQRA
jgi:hypothetical protein